MLFSVPRIVCEGDVIAVESGGAYTHYKVLELTGSVGADKSTAARGMLVGRSTTIYERTPVSS